MTKTAHQVRDDFDHVARIAEHFEAGVDGSAQPHERYLLRHLPERCDAVLELGCGTGELVRRLAGRARRVVALDLSPEMIRVARARSAGFPNIERADRPTSPEPPHRHESGRPEDLGYTPGTPQSADRRKWSKPARSAGPSKLRIADSG